MDKRKFNVSNGMCYISITLIYIHPHPMSRGEEKEKCRTVIYRTQKKKSGQTNNTKERNPYFT